MPVPNTLEELLQLIECSGLLSANALQQIRVQVPSGGLCPTTDDFVRELVRQHYLTPFQAKCLLRGQYKGFFVAKYRVLDQLGAGGMGRVYLAEQTTMKRAVALKLLPLKQGSEASNLGRFSREARAVARLRHPHITQAYDYDQVGNIHFIAMEYVEGLDLQELVHQRGRLPVGLAAHLIRQAAAGLEHAHQHEFVHRDIKPGNLMVETDGTLKILDLGLVVSRFDHDGLTLAEKDVVLGTADYIAPEQAINSHRVDIRSDLYSLGCVLYFLLTAQPPFPERTSAQKLLAHQTVEPTPVQGLNPEVSSELATLLERLMAKDPAKRPARPGEVVTSLEAWAQPEPPYDPSLVRFPRAIVEQWIHHGGDSASASGRLSSTQVEVPPNTVRADQSTTHVIPPTSNTGSRPSSHSRPSGAVTRKRRPRQQQKRVATWVAVVGGFCACIVLLAGLIVFTSSRHRPEEPANLVTPVAISVAPKAARRERMVIQPQQTGQQLRRAIKQVAAKGEVEVRPRTDPIELANPLVINGQQLHHQGAVTLRGDPEQPLVLTRSKPGPILRIKDVHHFKLRHVILDGGGRPGPVLEIFGDTPGLELDSVVFRNYINDGLVLRGARGSAREPIHLNKVVFVNSEKFGAQDGLVFRAEHQDDVAEYVELANCRFLHTRSAIQIDQAVDHLTIRDSRFENVLIGIDFHPGPTHPEHRHIQPVPEWQVAGWFPPGKVPGFDPSRPPSPSLELPLVPVSIRWAPVSLTKALGPSKSGVALAYAQIDAAQAGNRRFLLGIDDEATLWVNGVITFEHRSRQALVPEEFVGTLDLTPGVNHVWLMFTDIPRPGGRAAGFRLDLSDRYVTQAQPDWKDVRLLDNRFAHVAKPICFRTAPLSDSSILVQGNHFHKASHHPVLVATPISAIPDNTIRLVDNQEMEIPHKLRSAWRDAEEYTVMPLGK